MLELADTGAANGHDLAGDGVRLALGIEAHRAALDQALHVVLVDVGVHLPTARVHQHADGLAAVHPLAGAPVRVQVQPLPGEGRLELEPSDFRAGRLDLLELHPQALAGGQGLVGAGGVGDQAAPARFVAFHVGFAAGQA
ncbi:hypothetical protein FQZ97_975290 [compost metagenome]